MRRTAPEPMPGGRAYGRPLDARLPGESVQAYRAFLAYLAHGSIRRAADALGRGTTTLERWSRRWRWPFRKASILRGHAGKWQDLTEYEERHGLEAAGDTRELSERWVDAHVEIGQPRQEREMMEQIRRRAGDG